MILKFMRERKGEFDENKDKSKKQNVPSGMEY